MWNSTLQPDPQFTLQYSACALHAGYLRLPTHTQNILYLLFFRLEFGYENAPQCYVVRTLPVLFRLIPYRVATSETLDQLDIQRMYVNKRVGHDCWLQNILDWCRSRPECRFARTKSRELWLHLNAAPGQYHFSPGAGKRVFR